MSGLCQCGCGQPTRIAPRTVTSLGWVKGEPIRFVNGHNGHGPARVATGEWPGLAYVEQYGLPGYPEPRLRSGRRSRRRVVVA